MTGDNGERPGSAPTPASLSDLRADDALVEAIRAGASVDGDDALPELLRAWKRNIDAAPYPAQPDLAAAERVLGPRTRRLLVTPVAAAAAAVGIAVASLALVAHDSQPGDPLWGVTRVVYADHARSVQAASAAQAGLQSARQDMAAGSPEAARAALNRVGDELRQVQDPARRSELSALFAALNAQLPTPEVPTSPGPVRPPTPPSAPPRPSVTTPIGPPPVPSTPSSVVTVPRPASPAPLTTTPPATTIPAPTSTAPALTTSPPQPSTSEAPSEPSSGEPTATPEAASTTTQP